MLALWRARPPRLGRLRWRGADAALRGIYVRALRRRATDALVRAAGLATLAGIAAGLFVRNNAVDGRAAGILATTVIAILLVPGWAGLLLPIVDTYRSSTWLAQSLGVSDAGRVAALAATVAGVYVSTTAIAVASLAIASDNAAWTAAIAIGTSVAMALVVTRMLIWADRSEVATAARIVIGTIVASAIAVLALGTV